MVLSSVREQAEQDVSFTCFSLLRVLACPDKEGLKVKKYTLGVYGQWIILLAFSRNNGLLHWQLDITPGFNGVPLVKRILVSGCGLSKNGSRRLAYVNAWSLVGRIVLRRISLCLLE